MNSKLATAVVAAAVTLGSASAFAYGSNDFNSDAFPALRSSQSTVTRAEVRSDYAKALKTGDLPELNQYGEVVAKPTPGSDLTRAEVRAETRKELRSAPLYTRGGYEANL